MATVADAWRPTSELEHRLQETVRAGDQESYFRLLADSELLVPVPPELVDGVLANETQPSWPTQEEDGRVHVLAYTSASAMRACLGPSYQHFMTVRFGDIAETWPDARWWLAIDAPAHGVGAVLPIEARMPAWFVRQVADGDGRPPQVGRTPAAWEELRDQHRDLPRQSPRPEFQPANDVERELLRAAANNDHDLFLQTLADTDVLLPVPDDMDFALRPGRPGFPWQTREVDGSTVVPVFTSPERLVEASGAGTEYIKLPFTVALRYWPNHDWLLAINSGSPAGGTVLAQQLPGLATWADQRAAQRMTDHFEPQNDVEQRLFDVARRRDTDAFYKTLLGAQVLVPADADTPWGIVPGDADFPWRPVPVHGRTSIQVFTSLKWMNEAIGSSRFIMPSLHEMVAAWPDADWTLVLNPGTPIDASMPADQLRTLRGPATPPSASTPPPPETPAVPVAPAVPPETAPGRHSAPAPEHEYAAPTAESPEATGPAPDPSRATAPHADAANMGGGPAPDGPGALNTPPGPETASNTVPPDPAGAGITGTPGVPAHEGAPDPIQDPPHTATGGGPGLEGAAPHAVPPPGTAGVPASPASEAPLGDLGPGHESAGGTAESPQGIPRPPGMPNAPHEGAPGTARELPSHTGEAPPPAPYAPGIPREGVQDTTGTERATSPHDGIPGMGGGHGLEGSTHGGAGEPETPGAGRETSARPGETPHSVPGLAAGPGLEGTGTANTAPEAEAGPAHDSTGAPGIPDLGRETAARPGEAPHNVPGPAAGHGSGQATGMPHERLLGDTGIPGSSAEGPHGAPGLPHEGAQNIPGPVGGASGTTPNPLGPAGPAEGGNIGLPSTSGLTGAPGVPHEGALNAPGGVGRHGEGPQQGFPGDASGRDAAESGTPGGPHASAPSAPGPISGFGPAGVGDTGQSGTSDPTGYPGGPHEGVPDLPPSGGVTAGPAETGYTGRPGASGLTGASDVPGEGTAAQGGGTVGTTGSGNAGRPGVPGAPNIPGSGGPADGGDADRGGRQSGESREGFGGGPGGAGASELPGGPVGETAGEFAARPGGASYDEAPASDMSSGRHAGGPGDAARGLRAVEEPEPAFEPGNRIDQELYEAASDGDSDAFLRVLLNANVLVPIPAEAPLEVTPMQREFRWDAALRSESAVQVFTSLVRLREVLPESRFVYADFRRLIGAWPRDDWAMLLNPGTRIGASLQGDQVRALSEWALRVGLVPGRPEVPLPPPRPEPEAVQLPSDLDDRVSSPTIMQKVVPHGHVAWYLEQGYDRVGGFVHSTGDVAELQTPGQLYEALGMLYDGSPFSPADEGVYVIRWPAYCPDLYRVPFGGRDEAEMSAWGDAGWVIERPPFLGGGFAPGSAGSIREYKVDSVRLPYGAEMYYLGRDRSERFVAMYDPDQLAWLRPEASTESRDGRTEAAQ
ncbi:SseB family protein [Actinomadura bangladeshensis]|uniref:SseB protein N-terminal domain-containing protein n=1 Tax=Actinomadura bangladeshensis TaxID=453573 RepID=A0A4R4P2M5_9ACTN|nr:SseB family protein [Actinomadura bangladeshensis]TDC16548.1 hypothetical protein E1284_12265 [Actinomadura bangladeshensis]